MLNDHLQKTQKTSCSPIGRRVLLCHVIGMNEHFIIQEFYGQPGGQQSLIIKTFSGKSGN